MESLQKYLFDVTHLDGRDTQLQFEGIFLETVGNHHLIADYATQKFKLLQEGDFTFSTENEEIKEETEEETEEEPYVAFEEYNFPEHTTFMTQVTVKALELMGITALNLSWEEYLGLIERKMHEHPDPNAQVFLRLFHDKITLNPLIYLMLNEYPDSSIRQIFEQLEQDPQKKAINYLENMAYYMRLYHGLTQQILRV